jgi:hypothetical protein
MAAEQHSALSFVMLSVVKLSDIIPSAVALTLLDIHKTFNNHLKIKITKKYQNNLQVTKDKEGTRNPKNDLSCNRDKL